jgi:hypothetical protein
MPQLRQLKSIITREQSAREHLSEGSDHRARGGLSQVVDERRLSALQSALLNEIANLAMARKTTASGAGAFTHLPDSVGPRNGDAVDDLRLRYLQAPAEQGIVVHHLAFHDFDR